MAFPFHLIYIVLFLLRILLKTLQWSDDQECFAPIYLFDISARCVLLFLVISLGLLTRPTLSSRSKSFVNFFLYAVLNPFCIYLVVQGLVWQIQNLINTSYCLHKTSENLSILGWIGIVACIAGLLSYLSFLKAKAYWRMRQFTRRWERVSRSGNREEINAFLYAEMNEENGLATSEIEKLPVNEYASVLKANYSETCPICFEDFKAGDALTALPKCEHRFHPQCINGWLVRSPLCHFVETM